MLLLLFGSSIFLFLSLSIGYLVNRILKGVQHNPVPLFEILLTGTAAISVYLNILSFFFPCDYWLLVPLLIVSIFTWSTTPIGIDLKTKLKNVLTVLLKKWYGIITAVIILVILLFAIVPPYNTDSSGYHYLSILWNEKYRIVPGLANLFAQFGFNSSFMVLSAPFSFTDIYKQSIYPINLVLVLSFFMWMLHKSYVINDWRRYIVWIILFICLRHFPINIASPSADALASILVFYIFFSINNIKKDFNHKDWIIPFSLIFFSLTIKISTAPLLLFFFIPLIFYKLRFKPFLQNYFKLLLVAVVILVPWLIRNILLSGYLVFPLSSTGFFNVNWKVPFDIALAEQQHISHAPKMVSQDFSYVDTLSVFQWFPIWIMMIWNGNLFNSLLVTIGLISPALAWLIFRGKSSYKCLHVFKYVIAYSGVIFWMIGSPDVRFGYTFLTLSISIPLIAIAERKQQHLSFKRSNLVFGAFVFFYCTYYSTTAIRMLKPYSIGEYLVRPLRDTVYFIQNDMATFKYVQLNNTTKLYIHDSAHHSINAPLPSCAPYRQGIKMRGNSLQDGFKIER